MRYLILTGILLGALIKSAPVKNPSYCDKPVTVDTIIEREASLNGIEPELVKAIIQVESGGDPIAVSHTGDIGIMQVNKEHLKYFGYSESDLFDMEKNIIAGTRLLREELNRFGNEFDALRAYNCGSPKAKKSRCGISYAKKVQGIKGVL